MTEINPVKKLTQLGSVALEEILKDDGEYLVVVGGTVLSGAVNIVLPLIELHQRCWAAKESFKDRKPSGFVGYGK